MKKTLTERVTVLETSLLNICDDIHEIKANHLHSIEGDIKKMTSCIHSMKRDSVEVKTDVAWLKRFFWIIATTSIGGLIAQILSLVFRVIE